MISEELKELYQKVKEYVFIKYGWEVENVTIEYNGQIYASRTDYCRGDSENTSVYINVEDLDNSQENLLALAKEREERERQRRQRELEERRIREEKEKILEKERRKREYEKLKKEFG